MFLLATRFSLFLFVVSFLLYLNAEVYAEAPPPIAPSKGQENKSDEPSGNKGAAVKRAKKKRRGCSTYAEPRYRRMVRNWQIVPKIPLPKYRDGYRDITLYSVNHGERIRFFLYLQDGTLDPEAMKAVKHLFRDKETGEEHAIHPRLVKLLYRLADKYNARQINVVSGYRTSIDDTRESKHEHGMAVDFMIPGVALGRAAGQARSFGHTGVGFYPVSGFIHMDVRDGPSYFWIDRSGPGKPSCMHRAFANIGAKSDRKWKYENDEPVLHRNKKGELLTDIPQPEKSSVSAAAPSSPAPSSPPGPRQTGGYAAGAALSGAALSPVKVANTP